MTVTTDLTDWLLDTDPSLRWQVERDLVGAPPEVWEATRARVATEGNGAALLAAQGEDGQWDGGAHFPAGFFGSPESEAPGQPWTATSWSLKDLREWGVDASALGDTAARIAANCRWEYDDLPFWDGEIDVCINSYTLASGAWLGVDVEPVARWFPEHQLADGGWNCEAEEGNSVRSSFHSTLNAVRGMLRYEQLTAGSGRDESLHALLVASRHRGEEYLLTRRLAYRASTGEVVDDFVTHFVYPNRYRYSALAALDHFREAGVHDRTAPDPRLADAVARVRAAQQPDGTWHQGAPLAGRTWFEIDVPEGQPSPWLTFLALRALRWWDAAHPDSGGASTP